jgi:hypothetical protein
MNPLIFDEVLVVKLIGNCYGCDSYIVWIRNRNLIHLGMLSIVSFVSIFLPFLSQLVYDLLRMRSCVLKLNNE